MEAQPVNAVNFLAVFSRASQDPTFYYPASAFHLRERSEPTTTLPDDIARQQPETRRVVWRRCPHSLHRRYGQPAFYRHRQPPIRTHFHPSDRAAPTQRNVCEIGIVMINNRGWFGSSRITLTFCVRRLSLPSRFQTLLTRWNWVETYHNPDQVTVAQMRARDWESDDVLLRGANLLYWLLDHGKGVDGNNRSCFIDKPVAAVYMCQFVDDVPLR